MPRRLNRSYNDSPKEIFGIPLDGITISMLVSAIIVGLISVFCFAQYFDWIDFP